LLIYSSAGIGAVDFQLRYGSKTNHFQFSIKAQALCQYLLLLATNKSIALIFQFSFGGNGCFGDHICFQASKAFHLVTQITHIFSKFNLAVCEHKVEVQLCA
jgi:hypothetical protein